MSKEKKVQKKDLINNSFNDKLLLLIIKVLLSIVVLIIIVPLLYVLLGSFLQPSVLLTKGISLNPDHWTVQGYVKIFQNESMIRAFFNTIFYATGFTIITLVCCVLAGYSLSIDDLVGRKALTIFFLIAMFFNGGLVPTYLVVRSLGLVNTPWVMILLGAVNIWFIILARTFFKSLPVELKEAARLDGASDTQIFWKVIIPLSKPIIFVIALYAFVGQWNQYFNALVYLSDRSLYPLQLILREILIQNQVEPGMISDQLARAEMQRIAEMIKYASIIVSSLPLLIMYPFFQKYFEKGVMVGSLK